MMQGRNGPGVDTPPEGIPVATGGVRNGPIDSDDESGHAGPSNAAADATEDENLVSPLGSEDEYGDFESTRISDVPPILPGIEIEEGGIELPSRFPSKTTSKASSRRVAKTDPSLMPDMPSPVPSEKPHVPRTSSRRQSPSVDMTSSISGFLRKPTSSLNSSRLPFDRPTSSNQQSTISAQSSIGASDASSHGHARNVGGFSTDERPTSLGYVHQHSIRTVNPPDNSQFLSETAEVVDGGHSGGSSMDHQRQ